MKKLFHAPYIAGSDKSRSFWRVPWFKSLIDEDTLVNFMKIYIYIRDRFRIKRLMERHGPDRQTITFYNVSIHGRVPSNDIMSFDGHVTDIDVVSITGADSVFWETFCIYV